MLNCKSVTQLKPQSMLNKKTKSLIIFWLKFWEESSNQTVLNIVDNNTMRISLWYTRTYQGNKENTNWQLLFNRKLVHGTHL